MKTLSFVILGLLVVAGCADTADDYDANKPVISDPADGTSATQSDTDLEMGADVSGSDAGTSGAVTSGDAASSTEVGGAAGEAANNGATTGETGAATGQAQPGTP